VIASGLKKLRFVRDLNQRLTIEIPIGMKSSMRHNGSTTMLTGHEKRAVQIHPGDTLLVEGFELDFEDSSS
jgi:hypothetical protein